MMHLIYFLFSLLSPGVFAVDGPSDSGSSLSLRQSIDLALRNNHDVLKATQEVEAAHAQLSSARSQFFPKIELRVDAGTYHDRIPQPGDVVVPLIGRDRNQYIAQIHMTQPLFSGFQRSSSMRRYSAQERIADLNLEIARQKAVEEAIRLYFGVQLFENQIVAEKEVKEFYQNHLKEVEHRLNQGVAIDLHQLQALYSLKRQVPKIQELEAELASRRLRLYRRLNLPLDGKYKLSDALPTNGTPLGFKLPALAEAYDFALKNNLDVRRLEVEFQSLQAKSGEVMASHLPNVNVDLTAGTNAFQRMDIGTPRSMAYGARLELRIPLFSGLDSFSDRELWHARLNELKEERAKLRETLLDDLNDTYRRLEVSSNRIDASRVNLELTYRAVQRAQKSYRVGRVILIEVLNAYSAYLEAKKENIQDTFDRVIALFHIKALLGLGTNLGQG